MSNFLSSFMHLMPSSSQLNTGVLAFFILIQHVDRRHQEPTSKSLPKTLGFYSLKITYVKLSFIWELFKKKNICLIFFVNGYIASKLSFYF